MAQDAAVAPDDPLDAVPDGGALLLYDGVCGLCDRTVQFVLARDKGDRFRFATLQGEVARARLAPHGVDPATLDTFHLVVNVGGPDERVLSRSRGAVETLRRLPGVWRALGAALAVLPTFLADLGYRLIARVRYRVFGKLDACPVPAPEHRHKFLG